MNCRIAEVLLCLFLAISSVSKSQQLVLRGDFPDPSVVKIGDTYWASATTSNWLPAYPLLKSKNLINWEQVGYVFNKKPDWADFYFWAPEISHDNGKTYIYYSAHKKDGNLCVGIASADKPEGPYTDHGPLICQPAGSIDAFPMRDENGKLFLIWKEDGNSVRKPTPIWAQQINEERTALIGEKTELFRNDQAWEANLVEGVSMIRKGEYFYAFYAAAGCCGAGCTYVTGIARSKSLLGPWEKDPSNPVMKDGGNWKCVGHGTPVEKDGKYYYLYHGYDSATNIYSGREGLLIEFVFTDDNWVKFLDTNTSSGNYSSTVVDNFNQSTLQQQWQWSVFRQPEYEVKRGCLFLQGSPEGSALGQKTLSGDYVAETMIVKKRQDAAGGIGVIGDDQNYLAAWVTGDSVMVMEYRKGITTTRYAKNVGSSKKIYLKVEAKNGKDISFSFSLNNKNYQLLNDTPVNASFLPPWDRALRVGLIAKGSSAQTVAFEYFKAKFTDNQF